MLPVTARQLLHGLARVIHSVTAAQRRPFALSFSTRAKLAEVVQRLVDAGVPLRQLSDHGTHQAVYVSDPDGNDLELAWDRPFDQWPRYSPENAEYLDKPLDLDDLLAAAH